MWLRLLKFDMTETLLHNLHRFSGIASRRLQPWMPQAELSKSMRTITGYDDVHSQEQ